MITSTGKQIITKYLIGQVPSYASYIAVGCGAKPLSSTSSFIDYSSKANLDFEMFRVPVTSRGIVVEGGVEKIVLTAQLPAEERYEISEVGLYPALENPVANGFDSRTLYSFNTSESWSSHDQVDGISTIPLITDAITFLNEIFQSTANNSTMLQEERSKRFERPRFLNNAIFIKGNSCEIDTSSSTFALSGSTNSHIHLNTTNLDLSKNSPLDQLKIAYSVITVEDGPDITTGINARIIVEFSSDDSGDLSSETYARAQINKTSIDQSNRYFVETINLEDLVYSGSFSWDLIKYVKIFASVEISGTPSEDYYIAIDAIRLENTQSVSSVYGLTGYSPIVNTDVTNIYADTVVKELNTSNYIEFKFVADVTV